MRHAAVTLLSLAACTSPLTEGAGRRAAADPSDAVFEAGILHEVAIDCGGAPLPDDEPVDCADGTLSIRGGEIDESFEGFTLTAAPEEDDGRRSLRVRLDGNQRLAGMRTLRFQAAPEDPTVERALLASRVHDAIDVPAPRVARASVALDGGMPKLLALTEHLGDGFFERRFETREVRLFAIAGDGWAPADEDDAEPTPRLDTFVERLQPAAWPGAWALASVADVDALVSALALAAALGTNGDDLGLVDRTEGDIALTALPRTHGGVLSGPLDADPATFAAGTPALASIVQSILAEPAARRHFAEVLQHAAACLDGTTCEAVSGELAEPVARRAAALRLFAEREGSLDAPDGAPRYAPLGKDDDGDLELRFRHLTPGFHAARVTVVIRRSSTETRVELARDRAADLWRAHLGVQTAAFDYRFEVTDADGAPHTVLDPANRARHGAWSRGKPAEVDVLEPLWSAPLSTEEPSGIAWYDGRLLVIGDRNRKMAIVDPDTGDTLDQVSLDARGMEGIAVDPFTGLIGVSEEERGAIVWLTLDGQALEEIEPHGAHDGNSGIEGLAFRLSDGHWFAAKEKQPARILEIDPDGNVVLSTKIDWVTDIASIEHSPDDDHLYILSDEDRLLVRLAPDLSPEQTWQIDVEQPEGLAIAGGRLWIVSDSEETLHAYELDAWRF